MIVQCRIFKCYFLIILCKKNLTITSIYVNIIFQMDGYKKIIHIDLDTLANLVPKEKYLFITKGIIYGNELIDSNNKNNKYKYKNNCNNPIPEGILLKLFCFPDKQIITILKWSKMSEAEETALILDIHKSRIKNDFVADDDKDMMEAYQDFEDDMDCNMALEVTYNYYSHINYI